MTGRRGLSLIEVVVTIVILGLAIPPLLIQIGGAVRQQEMAYVQQNLTHLASERLWEVFAAHADPTRGYDAIIGKAYPDEKAPDGLTGYERRTELREVSSKDFITAEPGSGIKRLRIITSGPNGQALTIESFVTDVPGMSD